MRPNITNVTLVRHIYIYVKHIHKYSRQARKDPFKIQILFDTLIYYYDINQTGYLINSGVLIHI